MTIAQAQQNNRRNMEKIAYFAKKSVSLHATFVK